MRQHVLEILMAVSVVGKKKRRDRTTGLLGNHQKCWLWGRHAVLEMLRAGRWLPLQVVCDPVVLVPAVRVEVIHLATLRDIEYIELTSQELSRFCGTGEHQGLMAKMPPYPYADAQRVLQKLHLHSAVLMLAGIQDPFNFGSILRSADLFGIDAVIVPAVGQAAVSAHVARSSVGAVNYLDVVEVSDLPSFCHELRQQGLQILAATEKGDRAPSQADLHRGTVLVIGNEGAGIPSELLEVCDAQICIPLQGHVDSLNAAVAAGILCYELRRQRAGC